MQALALALAASLTFTTANSTATGDQDTAAIATNRYGQTAVVWEDNRDGLHDDVWIRLFTNGAAKYETKLSAGGSANWTHLTPDVGIDDSGNAVVVWAEDGDGNGVFNIQYRVISPAGTVTASGRANAGPAGDQILPKVAVDPDGAPAGGAVAFHGGVGGRAERCVHRQGGRLHRAGHEGVRGLRVPADRGSTTGPTSPVDASGDARVVWDEDADANGYYNIGWSPGQGERRGEPVAAHRQQPGRRPAAPRRDRGGLHRGLRGGVGVRPHPVPAGRLDPLLRPRRRGPRPRDPRRRRRDEPGDRRRRPARLRRRLDRGPGRLGAGQTASGAAQQPGGHGPAGADSVVAVDPWGGFSVAYTDDSDGNGYDQVILGTGGVNSGW
ncbi:hypothetical protein GCM10020218_093050 [Dactylosporangium vinaceum]